MRKLSVTLGLLAAVLLMCSTMPAETLNFSTAAPGTFSSYSQNGFTVTSTAGAWSVNSTTFGNPAPSVFCGQCSPGTLEVIGSGDFTFASVDLGNPFFSGSDPFPYTITGYLGGVLQFTQTGNDTAAALTFATVNSAYSGSLDQLFISIDTTGGDGNLDNIVVNAPTSAPEPASLLLLGTGLAGFATRPRRRG